MLRPSVAVDKSEVYAGAENVVSDGIESNGNEDVTLNFAPKSFARREEERTPVA